MGEECWLWKETQVLHEKQHQNIRQPWNCDESATAEEDHHLPGLFSAGGLDHAEPG